MSFLVKNVEQCNLRPGFLNVHCLVDNRLSEWLLVISLSFYLKLLWRNICQMKRFSKNLLCLNLVERSSVVTCDQISRRRCIDCYVSYCILINAHYCFKIFYTNVSWNACCFSHCMLMSSKLETMKSFACIYKHIFLFLTWC